MARKLKTFTTSAGFFDLAVAAPSMKAALEAWGASANLFHQGFARVSEDPAIVRATAAKPGVVLRRPVGTDAPFREHADLPSNLPVPTARKAATATKPKPSPGAAEARHRERQERAEERERERRRAAIETAESALDEARRAHDARRSEIDAERAALDRRAAVEEERWQVEREQLETSLSRRRMMRPTKLNSV